MARKRQPEPEVSYVRHTQAPAWGVGMLVDQGPDQRTYLFADGVRRRLKLAFCERFIVPAEPPALEDQTRMKRGAIGGGNTTPKAIHLELEAAIRDQPDDPQPFLVYADWLQRQGDPRGELITVQRAREAAPDDRKLARAEADLFATHTTYLVPGHLATLLAVPHRKTDRRGSRCEVRWRTGFLDHVRIARRGSQPGIEEVLPELLGHPSAQFLRSLTIGPLGSPDACDYKPVIAALVARPQPLLRELVIGETDELLGATGNAAALLPSSPALERLVLRAESVRFETQLKHARLRELVVDTRTTTIRSTALVVGAQLPALESLELACPGLDLPAGALETLLARLPALHHLALHHTANTSALIYALLRSPALAQLRTLSLQHGDLTDAAVELLLLKRASFAHLQLDLGGNRFTAEGVARLAALATVGRQEPARATLTVPAVLARTRDRKLAAAARLLARPERWMNLGRDGQRLWGEYEGSDHYYVSAWLNERRTGCSCPSDKHPCKHALALLLMAAEQRAIPERVTPDDVVRHTNSNASWRD